jgi:DNA-binding NtrC family response regulator
MTDDRARVLVVDDMENMRGLMREILDAHCEVVLARDGAEAKSWLHARRFDLVLTDVRMPGADGFELVRLVKERWPLTEAVMMTAYASIPAAVEAMRLGAYDYVEKPFDPDEVTLVVARALGRSRERANAQVLTGHAVELPGNEGLAALSYREALASARDRGSREYLNALLRMFEGNVSHAAERAGLERESLHRLLRRHGIHADAFRDPSRRGGD